MKRKIIEIKGLCHTFRGKIPGLSDIDLDVFEGEFLIIAGRNGSGKTTLLKHINGLLQPTKGSVLTSGFDVSKKTAQARIKAGFVFQDPDAQIVGETVHEDTLFGPENLNMARDMALSKVNSALCAMGLDKFVLRRPHTLSSGEKRRLAIAGVIAMDPEIVMFDEPFSNLDFPGVIDLIKRMVRLHGEGKTLIVAAHDVEKVLPHADRLIIMESGRIVCDGHPAEIIKNAEKFGVREPSTSKMGMGFVSWLE